MTASRAKTIGLLLACALCLASSAARADEEAVDPTRLDVERLPPEALELTRDMYAQGFFVSAELGGRGMAGGAGRLAGPGPLARVGFGYEATPWLAVAAQFGLSFHSTTAPAPPAPTAFQVYTLVAQARFQVALGVRSALWLAPELGIGWASGDFLQAWGLRRAGDLAPAYGGQLGFDWHLLNAHHSLGLSTGAIMEPHLDRVGDHTVVIHASAYARYVF